MHTGRHTNNKTCPHRQTGAHGNKKTQTRVSTSMQARSWAETPLRPHAQTGAHILTMQTTRTCKRGQKHASLAPTHRSFARQRGHLPLSPQHRATLRGALRADTWMRPGVPVLSMRLARFTVLPRSPAPSERIRPSQLDVNSVCPLTS